MLVSAAAWGRSLYAEDLLRADVKDGGYWWVVLRSGFGSLTIVWDPRITAVHALTRSSRAIEPHRRFRPLGFFQYEPLATTDGTGAIIAFPWWLPCLAGAVLPAAWLIARQRRRRRLALTLCPACGYDLRASPDRCPECGAERMAITT